MIKVLQVLFNDLECSPGHKMSCYKTWFKHKNANISMCHREGKHVIDYIYKIFIIQDVIRKVLGKMSVDTISNSCVSGLSFDNNSLNV